MTLPKIATRDEWLAGWDIPWYSSFGTDFNTDFGVPIDESVGADTFNYHNRGEYEAIGVEMFSSPQPFDMPGRSCFPARQRPDFPYLLAICARPGMHRRFVLLPRPHRARSAGGMGRAEGSERIGSREQARFRILTLARLTEHERRDPRVDGRFRESSQRTLS